MSAADCSGSRRSVAWSARDGPSNARNDPAASRCTVLSSERLDWPEDNGPRAALQLLEDQVQYVEGGRAQLQVDGDRRTGAVVCALCRHHRGPGMAVDAVKGSRRRP
ncbi:hypothetical protein ACFVH0_26770 [Streptomyces sp. NPDC127117]|uniref:hypothetical protein n=1 Tax=Streptomyces sp. NPDC127117 TaxID=3345368 RepID=UPI00363B76DF